MNLLILGGTIFLGRHLAYAALARGHRVTLFNRGKSNPDLFPDLEQIHGDRKTDEGLAALYGRTFDAVIDTCGYVPRVVALSAQKLADSVGLYCFISSVSVYPNWPNGATSEDTPVATIEDPTVEEVTGETYGALKALCEQAAETALPGRSLTVRPGLIVGPDDPSDRFTYWPHRAARGGEILAPVGPDMPTQWIDVRDLSEWIVRLVEQGTVGIFNGDGPVVPLGDLLDLCLRESGAQGTVTYADEAFLAEQEIKPWLEVPLWIPGVREATNGGATDITRALAAGLTHRPAVETVRATLAWDAARSQEKAWRNTLTPEKEAAALAAWHSR